MQLVAIKYDAAMVLGDRYSVHEEAEDGFREVLELAPAFAEAHYNIGIAHQSQWKEALLEFNTALRNSPNFELELIARGLTQRILNGSQQSTDIKIPPLLSNISRTLQVGLLLERISSVFIVPPGSVVIVARKCFDDRYWLSAQSIGKPP